MSGYISPKSNFPALLEVEHAKQIPHVYIYNKSLLNFHILIVVCIVYICKFTRSTPCIHFSCSMILYSNDSWYLRRRQTWTMLDTNIFTSAWEKILWPAGRQILGAEGAPASVQIYDLWRPAIGYRIDFHIWCDPRRKRRATISASSTLSSCTLTATQIGCTHAVKIHWNRPKRFHFWRILPGAGSRVWVACLQAGTYRNWHLQRLVSSALGEQLFRAHMPSDPRGPLIQHEYCGSIPKQLDENIWKPTLHFELEIGVNLRGTENWLSEWGKVWNQVQSSRLQDSPSSYSPHFTFATFTSLWGLLQTHQIRQSATSVTRQCGHWRFAWLRQASCLIGHIPPLQSPTLKILPPRRLPFRDRDKEMICWKQHNVTPLTVTMSPLEPRLFFDWLFWWRTGSVEPGNGCSSAMAMGDCRTISSTMIKVMQTSIGTPLPNRSCLPWQPQVHLHRQVNWIRQTYPEDCPYNRWANGVVSQDSQLRVTQPATVTALGSFIRDWLSGISSGGAWHTRDCGLKRYCNMPETTK